MAQWAVIIPADQWTLERLFQHDTVIVPGSPTARPAPDDEVLLLAGDAVVALGRVVKESAGELVVGYTRRVFDDPVPAAGLDLPPGAAVTALGDETFRRFAARLGVEPDRQTWLVSVDLPIEATSPAGAVRQFWSYVRELGPGELPTFVSPIGDELAMQAFVLGAEANLDPEEDGDD